ncbi:alpha/beta hydrolase (plasmid) [Rhizobium ruizarguesonis]|uniref:Alpha/beta hydrolase n=1 Tax=Rhizobium ruizarguesonis TaxID=2081791 RepID=A0ABY1X2Y3_9HYPH|nr:alpha/beta hydrolase [Rhizobium ruizarguesonis]TAU18843.1 alpha/beta hydrolase [Rhizobium ruizarguesonis]TAU57273.1 alpha/beta hydrolase [Rhizobium ruizarguesonis]TAU72201.1 alpha/beta hydrolase [Rhizobium ruizarguesonis]TAV08630.1 alpha/beta hydrolase [Rhizobium ruizarguesonis]TAV24207.1 alpha/beta hydrolase [Rhizobium ruizarguesonis]
MAADPFRIRDHVADFDAIVGDLRARSLATRRTVAMEANVAYGAGPGETLDIFLPNNAGSDMPIHMFIHGGYWRMFSKEDYSCVAETITGAGTVAAIVDYSLMPMARMDVLVGQVLKAKAFLLAHADRFGATSKRFSVSGHSAGAHLATFLFHRSPAPSGVVAAFLLGGLYDLQPLQTSFLRDEIALSDEEVRRFTPMHQEHHPATRVAIMTGELETDPFKIQANAFRDILAAQGLDVRASQVADGNHMSTVRDLAVAGTPVASALRAFIANNASEEPKRYTFP